MMRVPRLTRLLCLAGVVAVATTGCGSSGGGGDDPTTDGHADASNSCATEATKLVEQERKPLPFKAPPGSVDMARMNGKTLWLVSITNTPWVRQGTSGFMAAAKAVGASGKFFDAKGNITLANQGVATAVQQRAGGIVLLNVEPKNVAGQLEKAKAAGIPVIDVHVGDPDAPLAPGVFAHVTSDWTGIGKIFAHYMLAQTGCKLNALIISAKVIPILANAQKGTVAEIERLCPKCTTHTQWMDLSTIATSLGRLAQTALSRDPKINYVTPMADAFASLVEPGITQAGKQIPIISHDGTDAALKEVRAGNGLLKATVAEPPPAFFGWAFVDQLGRAVAGQKSADWNLPNQIIDKTNIGKSDAELFLNYRGFEERFKQAWRSTG